MSFVVRKLQSAPLRFGVVELATNNILFSIGKEVVRQFKLDIDIEQRFSEVEVDEALFKALAEAEQKSLEHKLFTYLSKAERSPLQVRAWLDKRKVPPTWAEAITKKARSKNYLSDERYVEGFLKEAYLRGMPKWLLKKELQYKKVHYNPNDLENYNEAGALLNLVKRKRIRSQDDFRKLKTYLLRKGHKMDLVNKVLREHVEPKLHSSDDGPGPRH